MILKSNLIKESTQIRLKMLLSFFGKIFQLFLKVKIIHFFVKKKLVILFVSFTFPLPLHYHLRISSPSINHLHSAYQHHLFFLISNISLFPPDAHADNTILSPGIFVPSLDPLYIHQRTLQRQILNSSHNLLSLE